jgi:hypothetical protein
MRRFRIVLAASLVVICMAAAGVSPADAAKRKSFCKFVRQHTFEFTEIFDSSTSPVIGAAISETEIKRFQKVAPKQLKEPFKTFRMLLKAIKAQDSDAIAAVAPQAAPAAQTILDYVKTKCGLKVPDLKSTASDPQAP